MHALAPLAIVILSMLIASTCRNTARADTPACEAKPIAAVRKAAQARRDAGDPTGASRLLRPFVELQCLPDGAAAPKAAERDMASDYAWLLNDAYVNAVDKRTKRSAVENDNCTELLDPLTNADLMPRAWMSPALLQATIANVKACVKNCGSSASCVGFRANAFSTYLSLAPAFQDRACPGGAGQRLDDGRCIELRGKVGVGFVWSDHIKTGLPTEADERAYCPALYVQAAGGRDAVRLELPKTSVLRSASSCCSNFQLRVKPGTDEFMISSDEIIADCNGGTARTVVEEIYRLPPADGAPALVRDNSLGLH